MTGTLDLTPRQIALRAISAISSVKGLEFAPLPMRESFVATRGGTHFLKSGTAQAMTVSYHVMKDDVQAIKFRFPNFYVPSGSSVETAPGAAATISAALEYPLGSPRRQILFSGAATGSIPDGGTLDSDYIAGAFTGNVPFRVWVWRSCSSNCIYTTDQISWMGERAQFGASVTDVTLSGIVGGTDFANCYRPLAIIGQTENRTLAIIGDSIDWGDGDIPNDWTGDRGMSPRIFGNQFAYSTMAGPGDSAVEFVASNTNRLACARMASDVMVGYGTNDINGGRSAVQLNADMATIGGYFRGLSALYTRTITPLTTSSDSWATVANQTASAQQAIINSVNATRLSIPAPYTRCFDLSTFASSARDSGKWICDLSPTVFWGTKDGTHPSQRMYLFVGGSDLFRTAGQG